LQAILGSGTARELIIDINKEGFANMTDDTITITPGSRFRAAMVLAIIADALQIIIFPLFVEGALSPAEDVLDFGIGAAMVHLLGWHWEFLPSFLAKLLPGVDLVPFWTLAVANVYRKSKPLAVDIKVNEEEQPLLSDPRNS
jgi:hypothetical protein